MGWIDQELYEKTRDFLLRPELRLHDPGRRRFVLTDAFRFWDPALFSRIDSSGETGNFVVHLIIALVDYGYSEEGVHALEQLLKSVQVNEGPEIIRTADQIIQELRQQNTYPGSALALSATQSVGGTGAVFGGRYQSVPSFEPYQGPSGQVWKAIDLESQTRRFVAVKQIVADQRSYLKDDLRDIAALEHPHIVPIYDWDHRTLDYIVMRWIGGGDLSAKISRPIPKRMVAEYISQLAQALTYAHNSSPRVIHGNIKPSNILVDDKVDYLYLTDFTLVQRDNTTPVQRIQREANARDYFAPEQLLGKGTLPASDQYALGLLAYHLLTGAYPFRDDQERFMYARMGEGLPANPAISDALYGVLARACANDPSTRFQSAVAFADALLTAAEQNLTPSREREEEQLYLSLLIKDCEEKVRGYVGLRGTTKPPEHRMSHQGTRTGVGRARVRHPVLYQFKSAGKGLPEEPTEDVRDALLNLSRVILLGEPGSGKTTTLVQLALDLGIQAQTDLHAPIPVVIPLNEFDGSTSFDAFVRAQMPGIGNHLDTYLSDSKRLLLMFDALNEAPQWLHKQIVDYLEKLDRFVISCRIKDYRQELDRFENISTVTILDLDLPRIRRAILQLLPQTGAYLWETLGGSEALLRFWHKLVKRTSEDLFWQRGEEPNYTSKEEDVAWHRMHDRAILPLCRNPFMLNMVCGLYDRRGKLPNNRGELFKGFVGDLLRSEIERIAISERWPEEDPREGEYERMTHDALVLIASSIQEQGLGAGMLRESAEALLLGGLSQEKVQEALTLARDSNLIQLSTEHLLFNHQLIQEYFASEIMGRDLDMVPAVSASKFFNPANWWDPQGWEETAVILAGVRGETELPRIVRWIARAQPEIALRCITDSGIPGVGLETIEGELRKWLQELWLDWLLRAGESVKARAALGRALGSIGDPRPGTGTCDRNGKVVPDITWCPLSMNCSISKYPITVAQYQAFLQDGETGYNSNSWWGGEAREWRANSMSVRTLYYNYGNHPISNVNWYEASAFCQWFSWITGQEIRLPIEKEWLYAVREDSGKEFPWGDEFIAGIANVLGQGDVHTPGKMCAVGLYPDAASNPGVEDLCGNVWEWCADNFQFSDIAEHLSTLKTSVRILHGGSWSRSHLFARCSYRYWSYPDYRDEDIGFRVVRVTGAD